MPFHEALHLKVSIPSSHTQAGNQVINIWSLGIHLDPNHNNLHVKYVPAHGPRRGSSGAWVIRTIVHTIGDRKPESGQLMLTHFHARIESTTLASLSAHRPAFSNGVKRNFITGRTSGGLHHNLANPAQLASGLTSSPGGSVSWCCLFNLGEGSRDYFYLYV